MIKKLRKKFILMAIISVAVVLVLLCAIVNIANYVITDSNTTQTIETIFNNQGNLPVFNEQNKPNEQNDIQKPMPKPHESDYSTRYFVSRYDDEGNISQKMLDNITTVTEEDTETYLKIAQNHGEGYGSYGDFKYYVSQIGSGKYMAIFLDTYREMHSVYTILIISIIAMVVCIILVCIAVLLFSKKAVDPVVKNNEKQKQFITDASHELKTPITVITTSLKVLEMENGKQKWIDKAVSQTQKLSELVNELVKLSKMDEETKPVFSEFNISRAVEEMIDSFKDFAKENSHKISADIEKDLKYKGDEYAIRQLLSILIDNAVKYASENSPIEIALKSYKKGVIITSKNACENADTIETAKLFDRFYRADKARTSGGGFGIGLSIAQSIVEEHKGEIKAETVDNNSIKFTVKLK